MLLGRFRTVIGRFRRGFTSSSESSRSKAKGNRMAERAIIGPAERIAAAVGQQNHAVGQRIDAVGQQIGVLSLDQDKCSLPIAPAADPRLGLLVGVDAVVGRQPIFDRELEVLGYELLFCTGDHSSVNIVDHHAATSTVVLNALSEIGLQRIVGSRRAWIKVSREFLLGGLAITVPPDLVGLQLLENQLIDDEFVRSISDLRRRGYRIALDNYRYSADTEPLLALVDIVKLNLPDLGHDGFAEQVRLLRNFEVILLGTKIETHEDHRFARELGCQLFQGFFYQRPELVAARRVDPSRLAVLKLIALLNDPKLELGEAEQLIAHDLTLSLRLLRYINSAYFATRSEVVSIGQAVALLGIEQLKGWVTLTAFASVDNKPSELTVTALVRARFCELAGSHTTAEHRGQLFMLGLFSIIDALLDTPIAEILDSVPFPEDMRAALIRHSGPMGTILRCIMALEAGATALAESILPGCGQLYVEALAWTNQAGTQLIG
jgi:EAL and modified HD-GYP domain-containing signal transduction protein